MKVEWVKLCDEEPPEDSIVVLSILVDDGKMPCELELTMVEDVKLWDGPYFKATHWLKGLEHPK